MAKKVTKSGSGSRTFEGSSKGGKFQKALNAALQELNDALNDDGVADASASWSLDSVSGSVGGIAGSRKLTVTILATR